MVKNKNKLIVLFLEFYDITELNEVDLEDISNKNLTKIKYIGFLHSETDTIYRMMNFFDIDTSDLLIVPKSLVLNKKKIEV